MRRAIPPSSFVFLDEVDLVSLVGDGERRIHTGDAAAYNERPLVDGQVKLLKWLQLAGPGDGHPDDVVGLFGCLFLFFRVDPGVVLPDIGHLEVILVESRFTQGVAEERFECPRENRPR